MQAVADENKAMAWFVQQVVAVEDAVADEVGAVAKFLEDVYRSVRTYQDAVLCRRYHHAIQALVLHH